VSRRWYIPRREFIVRPHLWCGSVSMSDIIIQSITTDAGKLRRNWGKSPLMKIGGLFLFTIGDLRLTSAGGAHADANRA